MENKQLKSFKDLTVWQKSSDLAVLIYKITENFPKSELYGLTSQMRRAVISISSNIAEGFKRNHKKEKLQFYNVAYSSAAELESQIEISYRLGYLTEQDYQKLSSAVIEIEKMIDGLIKSLNKKFPKSHILNSIFFLVLLYSIFYILIPSSVLAAILYLEPSSGQFQPGDTFMIDVKIDTEGECVNAVEASLVYDKDILKAADFSRGESILSVWINPPVINQEQGLISFAGGVPGGYCGRIPGDPGDSNSLGKVIFKIPGLIVKEVQPPSEVEPLKIEFLETSKVLLNDGFGTPAKLTTQGATFEILSKGEPFKEEWKEELTKDMVLPEPFKIEIQKDPLIFEGKYFIVFATSDKQTGLDYFEIKEGERNWKRAESPYLLEDQELKNIIKVKAVDKAGNERIAEYRPEISKKPLPYWIIILILIGAGMVWWIFRKFRNK